MINLSIKIPRIKHSNNDVVTVRSKAYEDLDGEIWCPIKFNPSYKISNKGRILTTQDTIAKPFVNNSGYLCIGLWCENRKHNELVHKLVAMHFMQYNSNYDIDHIDGNKQNNDVSNLQLISHSENCMKRSKYSFARVTKDGKVIKLYTSFRNGGHELGFSGETLRRRIKDEDIVKIYNIKKMEYMYFKKV